MAKAARANNCQQGTPPAKEVLAENNDDKDGLISRSLIPIWFRRAEIDWLISFFSRTVYGRLLFLNVKKLQNIHVRKHTKTGNRRGGEYLRNTQADSTSQVVQ
jgi:hypothetical protein